MVRSLASDVRSLNACSCNVAVVCLSTNGRVFTWGILEACFGLDGFSKKTIGIQVDKVAPICLPVPAAYEKKSAIDVRLVGWGYRTSNRIKPNGKIYAHFCETNGAREPNYQLYPNTGGISIVECDYKNSRKNT